MAKRITKYPNRLNVRISKEDYDYLIENEVVVSALVRNAIERHKRWN